MKISWGYKITFVYLTFVGGIAFLVLKANSEKFDLVTKDYYSDELKYQQVIDESANTARLSASMQVEKNPGSLTIRFPDELKGKKKQVDFYLYYPADEKKDFRKSLNVSDVVFTQALPTNISGSYELKLYWVADTVKYYYEKKIIF